MIARCASAPTAEYTAINMNGAAVQATPEISFTGKDPCLNHTTSPSRKATQAASKGGCHSITLNQNIRFFASCGYAAFWSGKSKGFIVKNNIVPKVKAT